MCTAIGFHDQNNFGCGTRTCLVYFLSGSYFVCMVSYYNNSYLIVSMHVSDMSLCFQKLRNGFLSGSKDLLCALLTLIVDLA